MQRTYTTAQVHHRLNVPKPTLRNWTHAYADHLSEQARPNGGRARTFTHHDLIILNTIRYLARVEGLTAVDAVSARLAKGYRVVELPRPTANGSSPSFHQKSDPHDNEARFDRLLQERLHIATTELHRVSDALDAIAEERDRALAALGRAHADRSAARQIILRLRGALTGAAAALLGLLLMLLAAVIGRLP